MYAAFSLIGFTCIRLWMKSFKFFHNCFLVFIESASSNTKEYQCKYVKKRAYARKRVAQQKHDHIQLIIYCLNAGRLHLYNCLDDIRLELSPLERKSNFFT